MADIPAPLAAKVGPYPVVAWAGIIGGGVALGLIIRARRKSTGAPDGTLDVISDENGTPTGTTSVPIGARTIPLPTNAAPATGAAEPATNLEWSIAAIRWLVSTGADPSTAQAATERFLAGYGLTTNERQLVGKAIAQLGPPPESAPPIIAAPDTPPSSTAPTFTAGADNDPPAAQITPPGALVSHDGNTVFWTDGSRIEWVRDGNRSVALWQAGARVASVVNEGRADAYPVPLPMSADAIRSLRILGPYPPGF